MLGYEPAWERSFLHRLLFLPSSMEAPDRADRSAEWIGIPRRPPQTHGERHRRRVGHERTGALGLEVQDTLSVDPAWLCAESGKGNRKGGFEL